MKNVEYGFYQIPADTPLGVAGRASAARRQSSGSVASSRFSKWPNRCRGKSRWDQFRYFSRSGGKLAGSEVAENLLSSGGHPQFGPLWQWLAEHNQTLRPALGGKLVLFGEWCFAVHTVQYSRLPDWLLAFDVFDRMKGSFWSTELRDRWLSQLNIAGVPELAKGEFSLAELKTFLEENSRLGEAPMEGLYLRREEGQRLRIRCQESRSRPDFVETIDQHWSARSLTRNRRAKPSFR